MLVEEALYHRKWAAEGRRSGANSIAADYAGRVKGLRMALDIIREMGIG